LEKAKADSIDYIAEAKLEKQKMAEVKAIFEKEKTSLKDQTKKLEKRY